MVHYLKKKKLTKLTPKHVGHDGEIKTLIFSHLITVLGRDVDIKIKYAFSFFPSHFFDRG